MALNATAEEEAIIKKRYLTQTAQTAANALPPFKRLTKRYLQFCQALEGGTVEDAERLHGELLADLYAVQFHMAKLGEASGAFRREQAMYAEAQEQLRASIAKAEQDIEDRKRELEQARVELKHKQEYEVLKKQVVQVPARSSTRAEMGAVQHETAELAQQAQQLDELFARRKQQFAAVTACIEEVHATVEAESPEEGALPVEAGGEGAAGLPPPPPLPAQLPPSGAHQQGQGQGGQGQGGGSHRHERDRGRAPMQLG